MEQKARALGTYALYLFLVVLILLLQRAQLVVASIVIVIMSQHLHLLWIQKWDAMHYASVALLVFMGYFTLLYLFSVLTILTYVLGILLIIACAVLFLAQMIDGWRTYNLLDRMVANRQKPSNES